MDNEGEELIRKAQQWATGANIHYVINIVAAIRGSKICIENSKDEKEKELWEAYSKAMYGRLFDFMNHGNYSKAREDNPVPKELAYKGRQSRGQ